MRDDLFESYCVWIMTAGIRLWFILILSLLYHFITLGILIQIGKEFRRTLLRIGLNIYLLISVVIFCDCSPSLSIFQIALSVAFLIVSTVFLIMEISFNLIALKNNQIEHVVAIWKLPVPKKNKLTTLLVCIWVACLVTISYCVTRVDLYTDRDLDGVPMPYDECLNQKGEKPSGCPDSDHDGVVDKHDACPQVFGKGSNGCEISEPEMVFVEGGTFAMGSEFGDPDEIPVHTVTLTSFNIGKFELTQAQWKAVMGSNPSYFSGCDNCPVENVSWNDVQQYISILNSQTGKGYRLPTEAEWEYAAKGGLASKSYTFSGSNNLGSVAWYSDNSSSKTHPAGGKQANELGIYDMNGNADEWCQDWYGRYDSISRWLNPTGVSSGAYRVCRGNSWAGGAMASSTSHRAGDYQDGRKKDLGFRLVLPVGR
jgi:formylglycine-generating enzyme required for sulfatase activity